MTDQRCAVAIDVGGTRRRVALVDRQGHIIAVRKGDTQARQGPRQAARRIQEAVRELLREGGAEAAAVGVSVASPVHPDTGVMVNPPNMPGWNGFSLKPGLEEALGVPVYVGNDANLAALGEHRFGAGQGLSNLVFVTVSTGVGGGMLVDGRLLTGARGFAGEVGHIVIDPAGPKRPNSPRGSLETMASGTAIARRARERLASGGNGLLREWAGADPDSITAETVAKAARQGDALARAIYDETATYLGLGLVSLIHIFDPEAVLLGGGVTRDYDLWSAAMLRTVEENLMDHQKGQDLVRLCALGDDVSLYGAAALAFDALDGR